MGDILFTHNVGDSKLLLAVTECFTVILHPINVENHYPNNWPNHRLSGFPDRSVLGPASRWYSDEECHQKSISCVSGAVARLLRLVWNQLDALRAFCRNSLCLNGSTSWVVSIDSNFLFSDAVRVVFVRQLFNLTTYFFIASDVMHVLAELLIADEPVVNTQEKFLLAFLLERVRDVVLVIPFFLPVAVPVGSPFLDVIIGNRKEDKSVLDESLVLFRSISQEVPARAVDDADVPVRQTYFAQCFGFHIE